MKKKIKIWWIVSGIIIAVCVWIFFVPKKAKSPNYKTVKVERGDIISMISAAGTVNAVTSVDVGSQVSGIIQDIFVCKKGRCHCSDRPFFGQIKT